MGSAVALGTSDVVAGTWDTSARTFTAGGASPNAVKVSVHRTAYGGNAIPLVFAGTIGIPTCDVNVTSIAMITYQSSVTYVAPATGDPWLAGMPRGHLRQRV